MPRLTPRTCAGKRRSIAVLLWSSIAMAITNRHARYCNRVCREWPLLRQVSNCVKNCSSPAICSTPIGARGCRPRCIRKLSRVSLAGRAGGMLAVASCRHIRRWLSHSAPRRMAVRSSLHPLRREVACERRGRVLDRSFRRGGDCRSSRRSRRARTCAARVVASR